MPPGLEVDVHTGRSGSLLRRQDGCNSGLAKLAFAFFQEACAPAFSSLEVADYLIQRAASIWVRPNPNRGSPLDKVVGHFQVTLLDCEKQSRLPGIISVVDLKAKIKQELHNRHVAARCGIKQGCLSMDILLLLQVHAHGHTLLR